MLQEPLKNSESCLFLPGSGSLNTLNRGYLIKADSCDKLCKVDSGKARQGSLFLLRIHNVRININTMLESTS